MIRKLTLVAFLLLCAGGIHAQTPTDSEKNAYCHYVQTAADAERTLDTGLQAFGGVGQSNSNSNSTQAEIGLQKSLSKHLQGNAAVRLAELQCDLYEKRLDVERVVKYRMPLIDNRVALQRISDLADVLSIADEELAAVRKREQAQAATSNGVMTLMQRRADIYEQYLSAKAVATSADYPVMPDGSPEQSLIDVNQLARQVQEESNRKAALQTWDVSVGAGMRKTLNADVGGGASGYHPFAMLNVTYNFNASAYKHKLDDSTDAWLALNREQDDELTHQVATLQKRVAASLAEQEDLLVQRQQMTRYWSAQFQRLDTLTSPEARSLRAQVRIDLAIAAMNEHLSRYKIALLRSDNAPSK